jgi:uncharacterized protein (DUF1697 family)
MIGATYGTICDENQTLDFCFDAFSWREPVSTPDQVRGHASLENAIGGTILTVYVAMLRGVNVGGNSLKMDWLREACEGAAWQDVRTYVQSGNIVFSSRQSVSKLAPTLKAMIDAQTRLPVAVVIRSAAEMANIIADNPFLRQKGIDSTKLHVTFLGQAPSKPSLEKLDGLAGTRDQYRLAKQEIYLHCPINYGQTKLSNTAIEKALAVAATTRNWKTVTTLSAMAAE